jgi:hypothetical protein
MSTGSVTTEMRAMKAEAKRKTLEVISADLTEAGNTTPTTSNIYQGHVFDSSIQDLLLELA